LELFGEFEVRNKRPHCKKNINKFNMLDFNTKVSLSVSKASALLTILVLSRNFIAKIL